MSLRTGKAAWDHARTFVGKPLYQGLCKAFVREEGFNVDPSQSGTAKECWAEADFRHFETDPEKVPAYVWVFMNTSASAEHAVITGPRNAEGHRLCISVDAGPGRTIALVRLDRLAAMWGPVVGWAEDMDGQRIWTPPVAPKPQPVEDPRVVKARNDWREDGQIDTQLLREIRKSGHPSAAAIAKWEPVISDAMAEIYAALD